jgi:hypothetical protein
MSKAMFRSKAPHMVMVLTSDSAVLDGGKLRMLPGINVVFQNHYFETSNEDLAKRIRESVSFGVDVWEIDADEKQEVDRIVAESQPGTIRGAVNSVEAIGKTFKCEVCGKEFDNEKKLKQHMFYHREGVVDSVTEK